MNDSEYTEVSDTYQALWADLGGNRLVLEPHNKAPRRGTYLICGPDEPLIPGAWGAMMPDGIMVIDVDVKDGKPGLAELNRLNKTLGFDLQHCGTLVVDTPSGGLHIYLRIPPGFRTGAVVRGYYGIDVKGPGNIYVVGPGVHVRYRDKNGSVIEGHYQPRRQEHIRIMDAPEALLELVAPRERIEGADITDDSYAAQEKFRRLCERHLDEHGEYQRYVLACLGGDLGLSQSTTVKIMFETGFTREGTDAKVEHAYRYRQNRVGGKSPIAVFDVVDNDTLFAIEQAEQAKIEEQRDELRRSPLFVDIDELKVARPDWLIEDYIERDAVGMLLGESGAYKSFQAIDWCCSVATGHDWRHREVQPGPILYVAGEGKSGIKRRIVGWEQDRGIRVPPRSLYLSQREVMLPGSVDDIIETGKLLDIQPALIVLDTFNRTSSGPENDADTFRSFAQSLGRLRDAFPGVTCLIVHHLGKDKERGARGSSALEAGMDFVYTLQRTESSRSAIMYCRKMKDGEEAHPVVVSARQVRLEGLDDGLDMTTLVLDHEDKAFEVVTDEPGEQLMHGILAALYRGESVKQYCDRAGLPGGSSSRAARDAIKQAKELGYVHRPTPRALELTAAGRTFASGLEVAEEVHLSAVDRLFE